MKTLTQLWAGVILMLALSVSAFAGQVNCPAVVDPPPPPPTATGQTNCPALIEAAVSLVQSILSLP
jgi:hypothetical protein